MYIFKKELKEQILDGKTITWVAKTIGVTVAFLVAVLNGNRTCSSPVAYCIVKCLDSEAEIEDYFIRMKGE